MDHSPDHSQYSKRQIPLSIRRRYGYPHPVRGRTDDLADELTTLRRRTERLEAAGLLAGEPQR